MIRKNLFILLFYLICLDTFCMQINDSTTLIKYYDNEYAGVLYRSYIIDEDTDSSTANILPALKLKKVVSNINCGNCEYSIEEGGENGYAFRVTSTYLQLNYQWYSKGQVKQSFFVDYDDLESDTIFIYGTDYSKSGEFSKLITLYYVVSINTIFIKKVEYIDFYINQFVCKELIFDEEGVIEEYVYFHDKFLGGLLYKR